MQVNIETEVYVDMWDVLERLTEENRKEVYEDLKTEFEEPEDYNDSPVSDPVTRLELITALRNEGYVVEPGPGKVL